MVVGGVKGIYPSRMGRAFPHRESTLGCDSDDKNDEVDNEFNMLVGKESNCQCQLSITYVGLSSVKTDFQN
jgi:hypothetical protein